MDDLDFTTHVDLPIEPDDAWMLISDPESLGEWLGGDIDLVIEPGAEGSMRPLPNDTAHDAITNDTARNDNANDDIIFIIVEEVVPGERLALRWASASKPPTSVVFEIVPMRESSRIVVTERLVPQGLAALTGRLCAVG